MNNIKYTKKKIVTPSYLFLFPILESKPRIHFRVSNNFQHLEPDEMKPLLN